MGSGVGRQNIVKLGQIEEEKPVKLGKKTKPISVLVRQQPKKFLEIKVCKKEDESCAALNSRRVYWKSLIEGA